VSIILCLLRAEKVKFTLFAITFLIVNAKAKRNRFKPIERSVETMFFAGVIALCYSKRVRLIILISFLFLLGSGSLVQASSCISVDPSCKDTINVGSGGKVEFYRNYDIQTEESAITKLVIIVHGVGRNFGNAFARMISVYSDPTTAQTTLIVAPHFFADIDQPEAGYLYWGVHGWASGDDSLDRSHLSSYDVLDSLITGIILGGKFPNLNRVIVTGLSAGGQLTERYAAGSAVEGSFKNVHFRYLISSPSSYLYFDSNRRVSGTELSFAEPVNPGCDFNTYRYGLNNRNRYMSKKSNEQIITDFRSRDIVLMVGDQDNATAAPSPSILNDPKDGADLDISCPAELQGSSRYERAKIFKAYLDYTFPEKSHPLIVGVGIAHQLKLYSSPEAQPWL